MKDAVRSTWVRLPGRKAREDVDEGDARRARAMEGPSQSHPLHPPLDGFFICQRGWVRDHCREAASGFDKNAGRPLSHILVLRGTGTSMHNAFLHERSEPVWQGTGCTL